MASTTFNMAPVVVNTAAKGGVIRINDDPAREVLAPLHSGGATRTLAAIATAEAQLSGTQADLLISEPERVAALVRLRHRAAVAAESAAREYQETVLPAYATALAKAREALVRAQADTGQIERVITSLGEARLRALELRVAAIEARSELENALGGRLEEALSPTQR